jgi:CarD family transcriptional regulator
MHIRVGQKVAYPSQGVCQVEAIEDRRIGDFSEKFYMLRLLANNSAIMIPRSKILEIGVRPIINSIQCQDLLRFLSEDFENPPSDWKIRTKEFNAKVQSGDIFQVADVLKKLYCLSRLKSLSFREQRLLEKTKFLVVSEIAIVCSQPDCMIEEKVDELLEISYRKHVGEKLEASSASKTVH